MPRKIYKPEEIIAKLRQVEVLTSQGKSAIDAIRSIPATSITISVNSSAFPTTSLQAARSPYLIRINSTWSTRTDLLANLQ